MILSRFLKDSIWGILKIYLDPTFEFGFNNKFQKLARFKILSKF